MEAPKILNEKAAAFRDLLDVGGAGDSDIAAFFRDIAVDSQALAGGGLRGALKLQEVYGMGGTAYGQQEGGAKGYLYGKEDQVLGSTGGQTMLAYTQDAILQTSKNLAGFVNNQLLTGTGEGENRYAVNADMFGGALSRLDPNIAGKIEGALLSGDLFAGVDMTKIAEVEARLKAYDESLTAGAIGLQQIASDKDMASSLGEIANMPDDLKAVFDGFISEYKAFFTSEATTPEWFTKAAFDELINGDTSSSRGKGIGDTTSSRLSQTLGRHSMMDSALVGKRTITSAYRTNGLGSPSSDHVMGRAYDLTGQNLGGYSKMVHANGGFAEFHGVNSNRHLHVVPGPGVGDTMVPKRMSSRSQGGTSANTNNNYTINVEAGPNATAEQIATLTMRKIKLMQDNQRQRS